MMIKTKLWLIVSMPIIKLVIVIFLLLLGSFYENKAIRQRNIVIEIIKKSVEANIITSDLLLHDKKRAIHQLKSINSLILQLLSELNFNDQQHQNLLKDIALHQNEITELCLRYYEVFLSQKDNALYSSEYTNEKNIIASQLLLKAHFVVAKAIFLRDIIQKKEITLKRRI
ncbi:MAG: hypothetical protein HQL03_11190, partial [Nitrospirae bacterium]|nr:hypothetical protein [Nitrospirota bacterium]